jgi:ketol-acid reductoisomerase
MTESTTELRAFGEGDGELEQLAGRTIGFVGYGNQGRAQALNLRDSLHNAGLDAVPVIVGTLRDGTWEQAEADGFDVRVTPEVVDAADILFLLIPDEELPQAFGGQIAPHLRPNDTLVFASGYNLTLEELAVPAGIDVVLLAPRMIGERARQLFERGDGFYCYLSVERDASGRAWPTLLALAKAIGALSAAGGGAFELSARDETLIDLYLEQGFGAILGMTMFQVLSVGMEAGLPLEALILDLYLSGEMAQTFQAMADVGFVEQARLHSGTSQYGGMMRSLELDREPIAKHLRRVLDELRDGTFARRWAEERASGLANFEKLRELGRERNPFTRIEARIRAALEEARRRRDS